jgi:hypothetical protein
MAQLAENNIYLAFDAVVVSSFFKECNPSPSNATQDTTMGAGVDHVQRKPGLNDTTFTVTIGYDDTVVSTYIQKLRPGATVSFEYGPEGAVSGKPRHVQSCIVSGAPHTVSVSKTPVAFQVTLQGADAPSVDMYAGGVYS